MLATSSATAVGGGFNIMAAAARQGLPVLYAGGHGTGPWGDLVRAALAAEGIGILRPRDEHRDTGFDVALVEPDGERTFVTSLGAEAVHEAGTWADVPVGQGDAVYVSGYGLAAAGSGPVLGAWAAGLPGEALLFVDPGPLAADIPEDIFGPVLARCDWLSCNQREAFLLSGSSDPAGAAARLLRRRRARGPGGPGRRRRPGRRGRVRRRARGPGHVHPDPGRHRGRHHRRGRRALGCVPGRPGRRRSPPRRRPAAPTPPPPWPSPGPARPPPPPAPS